MRLFQVMALPFLLSYCICRGEGAQDNSTLASPEASTTKSSVTTPGIVSVTNLVDNQTDGTTPEGTTNGELIKTPSVPTFTSLTTEKSKETTPGVIKNEAPTTNTTVPNPISNAASTLPSSQHKTENQSSIKTPEVSVATNLLAVSPKTTVSSSASLTTAKTISQDTEDGKVTATPSMTLSYSSVILPVVIALIVITLLVFTLVGLYRICWKRDPGTPENGNDQPQSDKESVKLLTVKTISHESGEHSSQGKTKN